MEEIKITIMRTIFSNTWLICFMSVAVLGGNLYYSIVTSEVHWFQRSGSIVVLLGVLIVARRVIRLGKDHQNEDWNLPNETPEGKRVLLDQRSEYVIGPVIAVIGTVVWGYGDLLLIM